MDMEPNAARVERNQSIWHANRKLGVGATTLASQYGLSRVRIRQIVARQDQLQSDLQGAQPQGARVSEEVEGRV